MFKPGDKVICVNSFLSTGLTINKTYIVIDSFLPKWTEIVVQNDDGKFLVYDTFLFISIREYRKLKLDKLCLSQEIK